MVLTATMTSGSARIYSVEQRDDFLLEWIRDVGAGEVRGFDGLQQLRQPPPGQAIDIEQMVIAIDPRRSERLGEQCRRYRPLDIRTEEPD